MVRPRYRCPLCQVIYYSARAVCVGGWPIHDPARPGAFIPDHAEVRVEPDGQTAGPVHLVGPCAQCQWSDRCAWCNRPPVTGSTVPTTTTSTTGEDV